LIGTAKGEFASDVFQRVLEREKRMAYEYLGEMIEDV
jgi:hypothetical protein